MLSKPEGALEGFYAALWLGALLIAGHAAIDPFHPFPNHLDELATQFFERFRPIAKA